MADYLPVYVGGFKPFTRSVSAAVAGGQLVEVTTAGAVGPAAAGSAKVVGVAAFDGSGGRVSVWPLVNIEHEVNSTGTIAVGDGIAAGAIGGGAAGLAVTAVVATAAAAGTLLGIATSAATGGSKVRFIGRN